MHLIGTLRQLKRWVSFLPPVVTSLQLNTHLKNAKPASKRSTVAKESHVTPIKAATKTAAKKTSRAVKPAATTAALPKTRTAEKKYHSTAKRARTTGSSTRRTVGRKAATAQGTAKKVKIRSL